MSLVIPDLIVCNTINLALAAIRTDYRSNVIANTEDQSLLYLLFNGLNLGKYDLYANVKTLLITTAETNPKVLEAKLSYDHNAQTITPAIYVSLPAENDKNNSMGFGVGDEGELLIENDAPSQDEYREQYTRRWGTTYYIVIISDNRNEMLVLYNLVKALLITCHNHLHGQGLHNLKIGGQDLNITPQTDRLFKRAITLNFEYEQTIPELVVKAIYRKINLYYQLEGADTREGPILVEDDESDSI